MDVDTDNVPVKVTVNGSGDDDISPVHSCGEHLSFSSNAPVLHVGGPGGRGGGGLKVHK